MPYATGRRIHDADSHVMEPADWLEGLIAGPKGRFAWGAFDPAERVEALNELGFASQLVFPTSALRPFRTSSSPDVVYAGARAANRAMAAFCRDGRLLGVAYVP